MLSFFKQSNFILWSLLWQHMSSALSSIRFWWHSHATIILNTVESAWLLFFEFPVGRHSIQPVEGPEFRRDSEPLRWGHWLGSDCQQVLHWGFLASWVSHRAAFPQMLGSDEPTAASPGVIRPSSPHHALAKPRPPHLPSSWIYIHSRQPPTL